MNLVLLEPIDFTGADRVVLRGRRRDHILAIHRAAVGDTLVVGLVDGGIGTGTIESIDSGAVAMRVALDREPPPPARRTLVLALPRPKVLNRVIASAAALGLKRIALINAWRVEKSYWKSPRLSGENLRAQCVAGLEQARDTVIPQITQHRFFRAFVEEALPALASGSLALVAHPAAHDDCPRGVAGSVTLAIGPEGGFIPEELASLEAAGFCAVAIGPRILRVETAVAVILGRLGD